MLTDVWYLFEKCHASDYHVQSDKSAEHQADLTGDYH